jgi:hypothetical protein
MGLAPSGNRQNLGKSVVAKVPVPIFSQPLSGADSLPQQLAPNGWRAAHRPFSGFPVLAPTGPVRTLAQRRAVKVREFRS